MVEQKIPQRPEKGQARRLLTDLGGVSGKTWDFPFLESGFPLLVSGNTQQASKKPLLSAGVVRPQPQGGPFGVVGSATVSEHSLHLAGSGRDQASCRARDSPAP